jgi:hypothetical protein
MTPEEEERVKKLVAYAEGFRNETTDRGHRLYLIQRLANFDLQVDQVIQEYLARKTDDPG